MTALAYHAGRLAATVEQARTFAQNARSEATRRAYESDWRDFESFCRAHGLDALPASPQAVTVYVTELASRLRVATIRRRVVAISRRHQGCGFESPTSHVVVRETLKGIANTLGTAPRRKDALTVDRLKDALLAIGGTDLQVARDRAIVLLGFWGGFRRSEIAALDVDDVRFAKEGAVVTLRRSKTDQSGEGREVPLPALATQAICPVRALRTWFAAARISSGQLFRSFALDRRLQGARIDGRDVARLVQKLVRRAQLEGDFSAHSLRAGFVTSAAQAGVSEANIMRVTGHRSVTILRGYVRRATLFEDAPQLAIAR